MSLWICRTCNSLVHCSFADICPKCGSHCERVTHIEKSLGKAEDELMAYRFGQRLIFHITSYVRDISDDYPNKIDGFVNLAAKDAGIDKVQYSIYYDNIHVDDEVKGDIIYQIKTAQKRMSFRLYKKNGVCNTTIYNADRKKPQDIAYSRTTE